MDLTTSYLGLKLKNPIVPSAGPLSQELSNIKQMEDAGAAAVVLYSLFEEQIEHETIEHHHYTSRVADSHPEAINYFPEIYDFKTGADGYLEHIRKSKEAVNIPIIASLNGKSLGGWIDFSKKIEQAGADALELNIYRLAANLTTQGSEIEKEYIEIVKEVKMNVGIPVAVKLHPFFTSTANIAASLDKVGADGLVMFNRFYQPDIDLDTLEVVPNVLLSTPMALRLPLRWIAILYNRVNADLAATSGIYTEKDVIKVTLAGAKVAQMLSCLLKLGIGHIAEVLTKMIYWMEANEYESLDQMRGSMSYMNVADPSRFERANYMKVLNSLK
ncbi:MAG: dihydroorotate dehydrogenase-like protein [Ignavibacteriaceae bacterium]